MKTFVFLLMLLTLNSFGVKHEDNLRYKTTGTDGVSNINFVTLTSKDGLNYEILVCSSHVLADVFTVNGIIVGKDQLGGFIQRLVLARNNYVEWIEVINRNSSQDFYLKLPQPSDCSYYKKDMHLDVVLDCFYNNSQINSTKIVKNQTIRFTFVVSNGFFLLVNTDNLANTGEGVKLYFNSVGEIDNFIKVISNLK